MYLTEEERAMALDQLHRHHKVDRVRRRGEAAQFGPADFWELGRLSEAEKDLPRPEIRRIIRERRTGEWVRRMRQKGVPLFKCSVCQEITAGGEGRSRGKK
eukprot:Polyplicarium_translucidae@DN3832_c0_g1_i1.p2